MQTKFRLVLLAAAALALALSPAARAEGFGRGGGKSSGKSSSSGSKSKANGQSSNGQGGFGRGSYGGNSSGAYRGSTRGYQVYDRGYHVYDHGRDGYRGYDHDGYYRGGYGWRAWAAPAPYPVYVEPYYSAWGVYPYGYYAYGYYPYWGAPPIARAPAAPSTTTAELFAGALFSSVPGLTGSLGVDGERWGFNFRGAVLGSQSLSDPSVVDPMPFATFHLTYSLIADPHARVRVELGASGIVAPNVDYYGPDVGASAQLAVLGPLALEGSAHWTPLPASILDLDAGAALHFGALGVKGGWRWLRLDDSSSGGGADTFSGPELSVGVVW